MHNRNYVYINERLFDMIDNYDDIMSQWTSPSVGCCTEMVDVIGPDCEMNLWAVQKTVMELANADYYYTKDEVNRLLDQVTASGVTSAQVESMIAEAIRTKADQAEVDALAEQVRQNTSDILNTYTKQETNALLESFYTKLETNSLFANYTKVDGEVLSLNDENITI